MISKISVGDASEQLDRLIGFFPRLETKATALFAVDIGMLGLMGINTSPSNFSDGHVLILGFGLIAIIGASVFLVYQVLFPELRPSTQQSLVYFGTIAMLDRKAYLKRIKEIDLEDYINDVFDQIWRNSEILTKKFAYVKYAFIATATALPLWFVYLMTVGALNAQLIIR